MASSQDDPIDADYQKFLSAWIEKGQDLNLYDQAIEKFPYLKGKTMLPYAAALLLAHKGIPEIFGTMFNGHMRIVEKKNDEIQSLKDAAETKSKDQENRLRTAESKLRYLEKENKRLLSVLSEVDEKEGPSTSPKIPRRSENTVSGIEQVSPSVSGEQKGQEVITVDSDAETEPGDFWDGKDDVGDEDSAADALENAEDKLENVSCFLETQAPFL